MKNKVRFELGEVVKPASDIKTYQDVDMEEQRFSIAVKLWNGKTKEPIRAKPASISIQQIPLQGEQVIVFKGTNQYSTTDVIEDVWYYIPAYAVFGNVNENILPGITDYRPRTATQEILTREQALERNSFGDTFEDETVPPIQPFEGDTIFQGRFGNVIRLGSTIKSGTTPYSVDPRWIGDKGGDPIITLSTHKTRGSNLFRVEDLAEDNASIYLTSTQKIIIDLSKSTKHTSGPATYTNSQLIGSADRIILQAKGDSIILDAKKRVTLNTEKTYIGSEEANIPLTDATELASILQELITQLGLGGLDTAFSSPVVLNGAGAISALSSRLENIKSKKHYMDK